MTIITDSSELSINLYQHLHSQKSTSFKTKSPSITFGIFKSREFLGVGSISLNSNPQWVSINQSSSSSYPSSSPLSTENKLLIEALRIKLKFSKETKANLIRTPSTQNEANTANANNNSMLSNVKHKKTKSLVAPIKISPLTSKTKHRHNESVKHKTINVINSTTLPNKQKRIKERGVKTVKESKSVFGNSCNNNCSQTKQSFYKGKQVNDSEQIECGNDVLHHSMKVLPKSVLANIDKQELENHIIDQTFEENINHDELLDNDTTNKSIIKYLNDNSHPNKIDILFYDDDIKLQKHLETFSTLNNDFNLLYSNDYLLGVNDNVLNLEVELIIEKTLELQKSFYSLIKEYSHTNRRLQSLIMKISSKMKSLLHKQNELQLLLIDNQYTSIPLYKEENEFQIQINDLDMWNRLFMKPRKAKTTVSSKDDSIKKVLLVTIMKGVLKNKGIVNKLSNLEKMSLQRVLGESDIGSLKQTPRNVNKNRNDFIATLEYCSNTNVNSPLVEGQLDTLKRKLLPLINENKENGGMMRNATTTSFGNKCVKSGNSKFKTKTQSKSTGVKVKVRKK